MSELLDKLLDFSRIQAGIVEMEAVEFDLRQLVQRLARAFSFEACQKGLLPACDLPTTVPDRLVGHPLRLRQVLFNLFHNAVKFTRKGRVVLR